MIIEEEDGKFSVRIVGRDAVDDLQITKSVSDLVRLGDAQDYADNKIRNEYHDCAVLGCPGWVRC